MAGHPALGHGIAFKIVLFPQLSDAVILQPKCQFFRIEAYELGGAIHSICYQHILRLEVVEEDRRLSCQYDLRFHRRGLDHGRQQGDCVGV